MLSLPIPDKTSAVRYEDITALGTLVPDLTKGKVKPRYGAHLYSRFGGWFDSQASRLATDFGQADAEARVLEREEVGAGDLFLYFGCTGRSSIGATDISTSRCSRPTRALGLAAGRGGAEGWRRFDARVG